MALRKPQFLATLTGETKSRPTDANRSRCHTFCHSIKSYVRNSSRKRSCEVAGASFASSLRMRGCSSSPSAFGYFSILRRIGYRLEEFTGLLARSPFPIPPSIQLRRRSPRAASFSLVPIKYEKYWAQNYSL